MAEHVRSDTFTFDEDEIAVLLGIVGGYSPKLVDQMGLDVDAFERVYEALSGAAFASMHDAHPRVDESVPRPHALAPESGTEQA